MKRNKTYVRMINSMRWVRLRRQKLMDCPWCEMCKVRTPAVEVHHKVPVESVSSPLDMERLMFDYANLQSLCHQCHVQVHVDLKSKSKETQRQRAENETKEAIARLFGD